MKEFDICAYCCKNPGITDDHVASQMFFVEKPTNPIVVPCCIGCQKERAANDELLRQIFMMDWSTVDHPVAAELWNTKITRAILKNNAPYIARIQLDNKKPVTNSKGDLIYQPVLKVDPEQITRAFQKIVQGLHRWVFGENWCSDKHLEVKRLTLEELGELNAKMQLLPHHKQEILGEGVFEYRVWRTEGAEPTYTWIYSYYQGIYIYATNPTYKP